MMDFGRGRDVMVETDEGSDCLDPDEAPGVRSCSSD
jgi:hypothetical protein